MLGPELDPRRRRPAAAPGRHALEDARLARRLRGRSAGRRRPARQPGPPVHLHHRPHPGRRRRRPRRPRRRCRSHEGDALRRTPAAPRRPAAHPATPRRSCPSCSATRTAPLAAAGRPARARPARAGDPAADRPAGHVPPPRHAVRRPHRRPGRRPRRRPRALPARAPWTTAASASLVVVLGTATEIGKTWVAAALPRLRAPRAARSRPASRRSPSTPTTRRPPTPSCWRAATGERRPTVCPQHRWYAVPMAPPMAADVLGRRRSPIADLAGELTWPPRRRRRAGRDGRAVRARPSPTTATASTSPSPRPDASCSWPTPGSARSTPSAFADRAGRVAR